MFFRAPNLEKAGRPAGPRAVKRVLAIVGITSFSVSALFATDPHPATPWFSPPGGVSVIGRIVSIEDTTSGVTIYYTTNGATPTISSAVYTTPISIPAQSVTVTIKAIAVLNGYTSYSVASSTYTITPPATPPVISPAGGAYIGNQRVSITSPMGGVIHYTTDSTTPTASSPVYSSPLTVSTNSSVLAIVTGVTGYTTSSPARQNYSITQPVPAPVPAISPAGGTYTSAPVVTLTDSLAGASIYYTTNGATPTTSSTLYTGPFTLNLQPGTQVTLRAIASATNYLASAASAITYQMNPSGVIATAVVGTSPILAIPPDFVGVSHEWTNAATMMGSVASGINPLYTTLMTPIAQNMKAPLSIRIGGGSTDTSGTANRATVQPFIDLTGRMSAKFILGVNLGANNLSLSEEQASTFVANMPAGSLQAVEIGNEPDGYGSNGLRPSGYSFTDFLPQYQQWRQGILSQESVGIAGPALGGGFWDPNAGTAVAAGQLKADVVTQHEYLVCYNPSDPEPGDLLLQPASSSIHFYSLSPYIALVQSMGLPLRVAEMNSICAGGQPGLSNSFSSALWAIDTMFEYASAGVSGVNWNTSYQGGPYDLYQFHVWQKNGLNQYWLGTVNPLYYGLLFFSRAAGNDAELLPVTVDTAYNIKIWATKDSGGKVHLTIINKELTESGQVQISLSGFTSGTVTRLAASGGYLATTGVTFGGQTFDGSADGNPVGTLTTSTVTPLNGVWTISAPPVTAVLVDLQ